MKKFIPIVLIILLSSLLNCGGVKPIKPPPGFNETNNNSSFLNELDLQEFINQFENSFNEFINNFVQFFQKQENNIESDAYVVQYVIDGDTFIINKDGQEVKVRLIGVDTPESVAKQEYLDNTGKENTQEGKIASDYVKDLITDKTVYLEYDIGKEDIYGRTLAYVYLDPEKTLMLQELLLQKGLAKTMTIMPNIKYSIRFANLEKEAKDNDVGFWINGNWINTINLNNDFLSFSLEA